MDAKRKVIWLLMIVSVYCEAESSRKKVCVIGAGPAGLSSLKQLSLWPEEFDPIAFESNSQIGGQWAYTDRSDVDEHGLPVHSTIYKYLRTNGPKQLIQFPDYREFYGEERSFVTHQTFLQYFQNYTRHFNLQNYIKLNTLVEKVSAVRENEWIVKTRNLNTNQHEETACDAVIVCSGTLSKPNIPSIPGIETFPGRVLHSRAYRRPEDFANQTVVILGASYSGTDIGLEISSYARTLYLSSRHEKIKSELPSNVVQVPGVVAANGSHFILSDGSDIVADSIVFCTGYLYDYSFLDASVGIAVDKGRYVHPLYKHLIHAERPTMAFIGVPLPGIALPVAYVQTHYFTSVLRGAVKLPSREEMLKDSELPPGTPLSKAHYMGLETLDYYAELAKISGAEPLPAYYKTCLFILFEQLINNVLHHKEYNYVTSDDGRCELVPINA